MSFSNGGVCVCRYGKDEVKPKGELIGFIVFIILATITVTISSRTVLKRCVPHK